MNLGQSCNYNTLGHYYNPINAKPTSGVYVVPSFGGPSYDTLTHDHSQSCGGYFDIKNAYGKSCDTSYISRNCGNHHHHNHHHKPHHNHHHKCIPPKKSYSCPPNTALGKYSKSVCAMPGEEWAPKCGPVV